jgi:hypothetical protein
VKLTKGAVRKYKLPLHEKSRDKKRSQKPTGKPLLEEKYNSTIKYLTEITIRRLHTLGNQRFGSYPFSAHFDRWLSNLAIVLDEFESHPCTNLDDQFVLERSEVLSNIKRQLEGRRNKEASIDQEIRKLSDAKNRLKQINTEYSVLTKAIKDRKNRETKRLYNIINCLEKEQNSIIQIKTGFFRGVSNKEKEQREIEIAEQLFSKQKELELIILNFSAGQMKVREKYERKREPELEQIKFFQKKIAELDEDGSLEERWFACETLIDALNGFLQRRAAQPSLKSD